jgi:nucleotide-binding universal stress UspA family protein
MKVLFPLDFSKEAEKALEKYDVEKRIVKAGKCWKVIIDTAEEEGVDMIVMTERGSGAVAEIGDALGSCAEKVARHARNPVLIVR